MLNIARGDHCRCLTDSPHSICTNTHPTTPTLNDQPSGQSHELGSNRATEMRFRFTDHAEQHLPRVFASCRELRHFGNKQRPHLLRLVASCSGTEDESGAVTLVLVYHWVGVASWRPEWDIALRLRSGFASFSPSSATTSYCFAFAMSPTTWQGFQWPVPNLGSPLAMYSVEYTTHKHAVKLR